METTMNDEFYVSLASDESAVYFDHANKQSHFTNKLPEPLILREKYVVGLTEIYIPPFFAHKTFMAPEQDTDTNEINIKRATRQIQDDRSELVIHLQGTGWIIHIKNAEAKRLSEKTIAFNGLMALFVKYFEYKELSNLQQDDPRSNEALEKLDAAFQQLDFEQAYTNKKQVRGLFFNVEMPYAVDDETAPYPNFTSEEVTVEMKEYDSLKQFLNEIIAQLPKEKRKKRLWLRMLTVIDNPALHFTTTEIFREFATRMYAKEEGHVEIRIAIPPTPSAAPASAAPPGLHKSTLVSVQSPATAPSHTSNGNSSSSSSSSKNDHSSTNGGQTKSRVDGNLLSNNTPASVNINMEKECNRHNNDNSDSDSDNQIYKKARIAAVLKPHLHMIFVFTDIIEPHMYASKWFKLLRTIPNYYSKQTFVDGLWLRFDTPEYYPVSERYIESISISVTNREIPILFHKTNIQPIYIQLHFKKKL